MKDCDRRDFIIDGMASCALAALPVSAAALAAADQPVRLFFLRDGQVTVFEGLTYFARGVYDVPGPQPENYLDHLSAKTAVGDWIDFPAGTYWFEHGGERIETWLPGICSQHPQASF